MNINDYLNQSVLSLTKSIKQQEVSPQEVLDCAISRMQEVNPLINAIVTECIDWGRSQLACMRGDEPFYGVPIIVKDLGFPLKGIKETLGSHFWKHHYARANNDFMQRVLKLGMVPFAKSNTPELGLSYVTEPALFGPCRNPYDLERTPGGSSGGSAAAVAAGIAPIATASDGGGSIRIPAACCGLFGFKPSTGATPIGPEQGELWSGMASNFILTRFMEDAIALFTPFSNEDFLFKETKSVKTLTIAHLEDAFTPVPVAKPCLAAVETMTAILKDMGYRLQKRACPIQIEVLGAATLTLIAADTYTEIHKHELQLNRLVQQHELEPVTWEFYRRGKVMSVSDYISARNTIFHELRSLRQLLNEVDIVLTPALAQLPLNIGSLSTAEPFDLFCQKNVAFSPFMSLFNQGGMPAMTIPVTEHHGLPVSVQLAAGRAKDKWLLGLAQALKSRLPDFSQVVTPKA